MKGILTRMILNRNPEHTWLIPFLCGALLALVFSRPSLAAAQNMADGAAPVRVAIVGLVHQHVVGLFPQLPQHPEVQLVGIEEPDAVIADRYRKQFHLDTKLFYSQVDTMIERTHPQALLVYTDIRDHLPVIQVAAAHGVNVMVEKPLATSLAAALQIRRTALIHHIMVLVNYETTWYASNQAVFEQLQQEKLGTLRKAIIRDGHQGPEEIGVSPEFLKWLTNPETNGAGALFDFGCYGADLMTWIMHGQLPISVTAEAQTDKPNVYPHVDDDAAVILRYQSAQAVLLPSWDWPYSVKNMEVYGTSGYAFTDGSNGLTVRYAGQEESSTTMVPALTAPNDNALHYLVAVLRGRVSPQNDLSSLDTNIKVMQILDAARKSARTGRTVLLHSSP